MSFKEGDVSLGAMADLAPGDDVGGSFMTFWDELGVCVLRMPPSLPLLKWFSKDADGDEVILVALKLLKLLKVLCLVLVRVAGSYVPLSFTNKSCPNTSTIAEVSVAAEVVALLAMLRKTQIPSLEESQCTRDPSCLHTASTFWRCFLAIREGIRDS